MVDRLILAALTADYAHALQIRKGSGASYSVHSHAVARITGQYTDNENAIIAAELHDVLEDVSAERYSEQQMLADFGAEVVEIVKMVSEDKRADEATTQSWETRKHAYLDHLRTLSHADALIVSAADKLHNLTSMIEDHEAIGENLWFRFSAPKERQLWYYEEVCRILSEKNIPQGLRDALQEKVAAFTCIVTK